LVNSTRFVTVKGTALAYSNWASSEPDNMVEENDIINGKQMVTPLGEHWVVIGQNGQWGSFGNHAQEANNPVQYKAVFEFDTKPECVVGGTTSDALLERECTDAIINTGSSSSGSVTTDSSGDPAITTGNTYKCQSDTYGNEFCPAQLAPCDTVWGYQDGYSVSYQICGDGTQPVNGLCKTTTKACPDGKTYKAGVGCVGSVESVKALYLTGDPANLSCSNIIRIVAVTNHTFVTFDTQDNWITSTIDGLNNDVVYINNIPFKVTYSYHLFNDHTYNSYFYATIQNQNTGQIYTYGSGWQFPDTGSGQGVVNGHYTTNSYSHHALTYNISTDVISVTISPQPYKAYYCQTSETITLAAKDSTTTQPSCSNVSSDGYCYSTPMTYYKYLCSTGTNEYGESYSPTVTSGTSSTPPPNNCKIESFSCVPATDRKCAYVSGGWKCSPFPCYGESNLESADTTVGETDSTSKGFNNDGSCSYQIRLFNGKDMRCRSWDILFGLIGGGCCQRDNGSGLGALFGGQCKEDERLLAKYRKETMDKSHYVGEYCSKYLKLGFAKICVQKKKTYCVFNSKLARIIHEQGRPQIGIEWGGAKAPNCKGFTPEEFQKIDFSKLDLSEFYGDLESKITSTFDAKVGSTIQQKIQSFGVNISGN